MQRDPAERRRVTRNILLALLTVVLIAAVLYIAVQLYAILHRTYRTETAIQATMSDSVKLTGAASFSATPVQGSGNLGYLVEDGERVTVGTAIAEYYTADGQDLLREELTNLDREISLLERSQNSTGSDLSVLTTQTRSALYNLLDQLDAGNYTAIRSAEEEFLLAQNRMQVSTGQSQGFASTIAELQAQRDAIAAQLGSLDTITASTNGYFVSAGSAGLTTLDAETADAADPSRLAEILSGDLSVSADGMAGWIVSGFTWRFYATCDLETAARFDGVTSVQISVPGKQDDPLDATVVSVESDEASGLAKVVIECGTINADVLTLGQEELQVDLETFTGIRISRSALHIVDGQNGVYVAVGNLQRFRKVTILYEDEDYILVPSDGALGTENEVRLYDEVIVVGTNLQDGSLM
ncbi:MAG TPA: hypothetical protein H9915_07310 [Candidatus Gemmiger faecigallinarum]|nr:hypothetical protein [Candidatus Gemmiger faecigallinarum]